MLKKILFSVSLVAALVACTGDYTDWAEPMHNEQGDVASFGSGTVTTVNLIDFANIPEDQEDIKICSFTEPTVSDPAYKLVGYKLNLGTKVLDITKNGEIPVAELKGYIESTYGKAPFEREIKSTIEQWVSNDVLTIRTISDEFSVKAKLVAPVIEDAYYFVGTSNGWNLGDDTYKFDHSDINVYDDPIFTVTVPAPLKEDGTRDDNWLKIVPKSSFDAGSWDGLLGCAVDGDESLTGNLIVGGNALKMPASDGAVAYRIELNMMDYKYTITPLIFRPYLYLPGDANGWGFDKDILLGNGSGLYEGYAVLGGQWGWKATQYPDWEHGDYGNGGDGILSNGGGNIMEGSEPKQYRVKVDLANMTYELLEITTWSLIGSITDASWGIDTDMTPDLANRCWTVTADFNAGEFKIRANHDWTWSLGGTYDSMTDANGANMQIPEAGNYTITFYPSYNGASHCTVVKN